MPQLCSISSVKERLGPICPTGVLPLLGVIAASLGCDLAVVERRGTFTHSSLCAQIDGQFHPD